jgi:HK97 family phage major capsid protein
MAITAATLSSDFDSGFMPPDQSAAIFERASRISVVQRLAQQVPLGDNGSIIPVVTGRLAAGWVDEGGLKPATSGTITPKTIVPKKIAAIAVVSSEMVRRNPGGYLDVLRPQMAEAFAIGFDQAALHDAGPTGTGGAGPFATYIDQTTNSVEIGSHTIAQGGVVQDFVDAIAAVVDDEHLLRGWALDSTLEATMLRNVDTTGRPLFVDTPLDQTTAALFDGGSVQPATPGRLLGRPAYMGFGVANTAGTILGYGGDWSQAAWGVVGGIQYKVSTEGTVTINGSLVSLFENNLVAILGEAYYGFVVGDTDAFVKLANAVPTASA